MPCAKLAISMPEETMRLVDRAATKLHWTPSRYIATVLRRVARRERGAAVSHKVDAVLAEMEQDLAAAHRLRAARRDEGTEW
jgi:hypothetical protein